MTIFRAGENPPGLALAPANLGTGRRKEGIGDKLLSRGHDPL